MDTMRRLFVVLGVLIVVGFLGVDFSQTIGGISENVATSSGKTGMPIGDATKKGADKNPAAQSAPATPSDQERPQGNNGTLGGVLPDSTKNNEKVCNGKWVKVENDLDNIYTPSVGEDQVILKTPKEDLYKIAFTGSYTKITYTNGGGQYTTAFAASGLMLDIPNQSPRTWQSDFPLKSPSSRLLGVVIVKNGNEPYEVCGSECVVKSKGRPILIDIDTQNGPATVTNPPSGASRRDTTGSLSVVTWRCEPKK